MYLSPSVKNFRLLLESFFTFTFGKKNVEKHIIKYPKLERKIPIEDPYWTINNPPIVGTITLDPAKVAPFRVIPDLRYSLGIIQGK